MSRSELRVRGGDTVSILLIWVAVAQTTRGPYIAGYAHDYADMVGKDHGRIETRRCWTTGDPGLLAHVAPNREWCDLASWVWVESERRCGKRNPCQR